MDGQHIVTLSATDADTQKLVLVTSRPYTVLSLTSPLHTAMADMTSHTDADHAPMERRGEDPSKEKLRSYLNHKMRVRCEDGRQFTGLFKCIDAYQNIILSDTTESRQDAQRHVGMIMVPGKHIQQVLVENLEYV
ncbi:hypothetical protein GGI20_003167 [Coemansia sp. BCRC 34301]|nr:hypothetical protein GGI20_003167 [Coemansia sp. BCRC 34301]